MSDCKHKYITTYVDSDGEPGGLWGCRDCRARFAPLADQIAVEKQRDDLLKALTWYANRYSNANGKPTVAQSAIAKVKL